MSVEENKRVIRKSSVQPFTFYGLSITDYTSGNDQSSSVARISVSAGAEHPRAWSKRSDKYYYVISGVVQFTMEGKVHTLSEEDCIIITKGSRFTYKNTSTTTAELLLVHTPPFDIDDEIIEE